MTKSNNVAAFGKRALMAAALRLAMLRRSLSLLGIRELAREAGLNPNTFYRHFKGMDDLGLAIIRDVVEPLRNSLREMRIAAAIAGDNTPALESLDAYGVELARALPVTRQTVRLFFDFVAEHPQAFIVGMRELNGPSEVLRAALQQVMEDFAADMAEDIVRLNLLPTLDRAVVLKLSRMIIRQMFQASLEFLEHGCDRAACCSQAEAHIIMLFVGAASLKKKGVGMETFGG
jgi:AcrR family transcriptional regulator